ncbi:hypothetical protein TELCIR_22360 [Teladorsagia circumcincta]|uniref:Uncharacterized protein n=1 Tax=Teladorsagia circumcincta TaxID=45464 RepID=A0A2G9TE61_TELCI|nr:hypothetical protein TELCIR_22360 [Teladorsagia circumcincta]
MIERSHLVFEKEYVNPTEEDFFKDLLNSIDGLQNGICEDDELPNSDINAADDDISFTHLRLSDSQFYYTLDYSE